MATMVAMDGSRRRSRCSLTTRGLHRCCSTTTRRSARTDGDCAHFGGHPYCQGGVCVSSGLGPADCFYGTPQQPQDFLNQCSDAQCLRFDNCQRLGLCDGVERAWTPRCGPRRRPRRHGVEPGDGGGGDGGAALPSCMDPTSGRAQVVYMTGSSNFPPLLAKLAPLIVATRLHARLPGRRARARA